MGLEADCIRPDAVLPSGAWRSVYKRPHPKAVDNGSIVWEACHNVLAGDPSGPPTGIEIGIPHALSV